MTVDEPVEEVEASAIEVAVLVLKLGVPVVVVAFPAKRVDADVEAGATDVARVVEFVRAAEMDVTTEG